MAKNKPVGQLIKEALDGRTQRWLSQKIGMPEDRLSNKIRGVEDFAPMEIQLIENALNVNIPELKDKKIKA